MNKEELVEEYFKLILDYTEMTNGSDPIDLDELRTKVTRINEIREQLGLSYSSITDLKKYEILFNRQ